MAEIPEFVSKILETLERAGHEAWCVGGCVRDSLLGRTPDDWDVTTDALPEDTLALFGDAALPTGLRHGTVTVRLDGGAAEVTAYRCDGAYGDHRHPDSVRFSHSLLEDLRRRDFTVNAMALDLRGKLYDPFDGRGDAARRILRCVGAADARLEEDALRILRCLRFSSVLDFSVEARTAAAVHEKRELLRAVAAERIRDELGKLLCGTGTSSVLRAYPDVLSIFLPELLPLVGFDQCNRHHCYDVWEHTLHALDAVEPELVLRCTMLLHDIGKPQSFTVDPSGCGHFYGHQALGAAMAAEALRRLRFSGEVQRSVVTLVEWHDHAIPCTDTGILHALRALGEPQLRRLMAVKRADNLAQSPAYRDAQEKLRQAEAILDRLVAGGACWSLSRLAVNGSDLAALGLSGPAIGRSLRGLLDAVMEGTVLNDRDALLAAARREPDFPAPPAP